LKSNILLDMKITDKSIVQDLAGYINMVKGASKSPCGTTEAGISTSDTSDKIELSGKACAMNKAAGAALTVPEVRAEKIKDIKSRLENGTYDVDPAKVAESIIKEVLMDHVSEKLS